MKVFIVWQIWPNFPLLDRVFAHRELAERYVELHVKNPLPYTFFIDEEDVWTYE